MRQSLIHFHWIFSENHSVNIELHFILDLHLKKVSINTVLYLDKLLSIVVVRKKLTN